MAVSAQSDKNHAAAARARSVVLRDGPPLVGGSHVYEGERLVTGWHIHDQHQIEYAVRGVVEIETVTGRYLLPPHQAAWLPAGLAHQTTLNSAVRTIAVMLDPPLVPEPGDRARILAVEPLLREMMLYSVRWPIDRPASEQGDEGDEGEGDELADGFFRTLGRLVAESLDHEAPLSLPVSPDPVVRAALAEIQADLAGARVGRISRAVGVSERTLRRRFSCELGLTWREYLTRARMLRAIALLADDQRSVVDIATEVGFDDASAFARAFVRHTGETPTSYRRATLER